MDHRVIFDTDPGIDDAMALLFAARAPQIELVGITTTFGNATVDQTTRNALFLADAFGLDCPVHRGAADPLVGSADAPPTFVHGEDGLGDTGRARPSASPDGDAAQFIVDAVNAAPGELTLVVIGRNTNLARALELDPDIAGKVRQVVVMGGALGRGGVTGNVSPCAEANIHGDAHAADIVMTAPWPLRLVPLDVTMKTRMTPAMVARLAQRGGEEGRLVEHAARFYQQFYERTSGQDSFPVHDSSAIAALLAPGNFDLEVGSVRVVTDGLAHGQTLFAERSRFFAYTDWSDLPTREVCVDVDADAVLQHYLDVVAP